MSGITQGLMAGYKTVANKHFQIDTGETLTTGLVSYFKLEDATDFFGTNNGINTNGTFGTGKVNNAVTFNGNGNINIGDVLYLDNDGTKKMSISFWKKNNSDINGWIISKQTDALGNKGWSIGQVGGNGIYLSIQNSGSDYLQARITGTNSDGIWHHYIIDYDGSKTANGVNFYIDNILQIKTITSPTLVGSSSSQTNFVIGALTSTNVYSFTGSIDEVGIWMGKILTLQERTDLYNSGNGQTMI